jgi:hypothetical protein
LRLFINWKTTYFLDLKWPNLGLLNVFLGVELLSLHKGILCANVHMSNILDNFHMSGCNPMPMPLSMNANFLIRMNETWILFRPYIVELLASWLISPTTGLISPMWWGYLTNTWTNPRRHTWKRPITSSCI